MTKQSTYIEFYCHNSHGETFVPIIDIYINLEMLAFTQEKCL